MSKTYKTIIYNKKKDGHKHAYECESERIEEALNYYLTYEKEND